MADEQNQPPHRGIKKGLYVIPTLFTAGNVAMGFLAVLASIRGFHTSFTDPILAAHYFDMAGLGIGLAILFDTVDGRVARATRTATEIGVQFDSLADVLTFGIAPTALVYAWAFAGVFTQGTFGHNLSVLILFLFLMCGIFQLARFNLQATRPRDLAEGTAKLDKKNFIGLPIPPAGGLLAAIVHFAPAPLSSYGERSAHYYSYAIMALTVTLAILMVSKIKHSSFKTVGSGRQSYIIILVLAAMAMSVFLYSQYALMIIAGIYVSHGVIWWICRSISAKLKPSTTIA